MLKLLLRGVERSTDDSQQEIIMWQREVFSNNFWLRCVQLKISLTKCPNKNPPRLWAHYRSTIYHSALSLLPHTTHCRWFNIIKYVCAAAGERIMYDTHYWDKEWAARMRRRETMRLRRKKGPTARNFSSFVDDAHNVCTITVYFVW